MGRNVRVGRNVRIWHFAYVGDNTVIGDNVTIGSLAHVDYNVVIGDNTRIEGLAYIPPGTVIGKNVFIGPGVVFTNDPYPPSKRLVGVVVEDHVVIGARSVILAGVRLGARSVVAMGSVVTRDVPPDTVVMGAPAKPVYSRSVYEKKKSLWEETGEASWRRSP